MTVTHTGTWLRRPAQATSWAQDMLRSGTCAILGVATGTNRATAIVAVDVTEDVLVHGTIGVGGNQVIHDLIGIATTRMLLAYNADGVRDWLLAEAGQRDIDPGHLEDPDRWGCIMRARSAALGTPDHLYPLGVGYDAIAAAWTALDLLHRIAEQNTPAMPNWAAHSGRSRDRSS